MVGDLAPGRTELRGRKVKGRGVRENQRKGSHGNESQGKVT